jgi:hypothetical protein
MATSPDLYQVTASAGLPTRINELTRALGVAGIYGIESIAGLVVNLYGGRYNGVDAADDDVTLTASNTNYVVAHRTTGAISASTATTNWNNSATYARLWEIDTNGSGVTDIVDARLDTGGLLNPGAPAAATKVVQIAVSDETTALSIGTNKVKFRMPFAMTVTAVRASLSTAQASGSIFTVDVNEAGGSILSTKLTIDNTETTSTTAATPPVISDSALADDAEISIDIDQIGDGTAKGLKVTLIGT